ncbi:hypothetical protein OPV22_025634 [Ensete ventricosum]|uniref:Gnk2-homologous domain-containing protein n=1 Tax=Ensete ventricosum TaxID=4639 RepID=A0AAV8Q7Y1_ENSVE|nr:hypothetical protein OPV22_025634 [Ensete ventricosum]
MQAQCSSQEQNQTKEDHMKGMAELLPILFLLFPLISSTTMASFDDYTSFVYVGCSQSKYILGSPYQFNVDSLLTSVANAATFSSYNNFTSSAASGSSPAYGLFQCRVDLPVADCASCVRSALDQLSSLCPSASGAGVQLKGCFLRYGNDSFLGEPDTTLLYKKCGSVVPGAGYNSDLLGMRDAALSGLSGGGGSYRVGAGGHVRALAQCVGDQSVKQCNDCVAAAVAQVKDGCGIANAGDAYLGKCYVSYWSDGVYTSRHYHGGVSGKTLAIIIGVTLGLVIMIIFLSFIRRTGK